MKRSALSINYLKLMPFKLSECIYELNAIKSIKVMCIAIEPSQSAEAYQIYIKIINSNDMVDPSIKPLFLINVINLLGSVIITYIHIYKI